jgi:transcription elongation factor Elf1
MTRRSIEVYPCKCGKGTIKLEKLHIPVSTNEVEKSYYSDITPCRVCGGSIDNQDNDLSQLVNTYDYFN